MSRRTLLDRWLDYWQFRADRFRWTLSFVVALFILGHLIAGEPALMLR